MANVVLKARDLDGYLTGGDKATLAEMERQFDRELEIFRVLSDPRRSAEHATATETLIRLSDDLGHRMKEIMAREPRVHVYSFGTPREIHGEVSRLIAKLRDARTGQPEFIYYTQRAYELLFNFAFGFGARRAARTTSSCARPSRVPVQNYAVHKIPDVDDRIENTVMCVMLRGALLPSMIMSKEIQEYSLDRVRDALRAVQDLARRHEGREPTWSTCSTSTGRTSTPEPSTARTCSSPTR